MADAPSTAVAVVTAPKPSNKATLIMLALGGVAVVGGYMAYKRFFASSRQKQYFGNKWQ